MFKHRLDIVVITVLLSVLISGCVKNQFTVEFSLDPQASQTYKTLYYASDSKKGWIVEGVLQVEQGKGKMVLPTRNPTIVYVFTGSNIPATFFYAERGDKVTISGKGVNPLDWDFSGNKINEGLSKWRKDNRGLLDNIMMPSGNKTFEKLNSAVAKYVAANPDNPVSTILLLEYYDRRGDEEGFRKCWAKLKGDAAKGKWREVVSRNDMIDEPGKQELPKEIILNTVGTGCDTIKIGGVPVLLNFSKSSISNYRETAKKIRELSVESDDSSSRIIANILLEPDSILRWQNARNDSLVNVVEGWAPLGLSDSQVKVLGISRLPQTLVIDSLGKVVYRGDDLKKAADEFKKLLKK